ncbi:hypothetical protein FB45DRAFT_869360 [Roridomyces roridus]|uniref:Uncharacterized protein n=1 Tax=Roridomyces roridus TaxID=1738132 RepID=A0AAD7FKH4_9AGAR|nr:hypothetical protein FB45DRAFT_869360 [Roridomyces roridus]
MMDVERWVHGGEKQEASRAVHGPMSGPVPLSRLWFWAAEMVTRTPAELGLIHVQRVKVIDKEAAKSSKNSPKITENGTDPTTDTDVIEKSATPLWRENGR